MAVAFKNTVRIYTILYSDFKVLKELHLNHCKEIGFNNSGSMMYAKLGGKQGSKIYIYNLLSNFDCVEILNTSRPVLSIHWSTFDTAIFALHSSGYYHWHINSLFKQRQDST